MRAFRLGLYDRWQVSSNYWEADLVTGGLKALFPKTVRYNQTYTSEELSEKFQIPLADLTHARSCARWNSETVGRYVTLLSASANHQSLHHPDFGAVFHTPSRFGSYVFVWLPLPDKSPVGETEDEWLYSRWFSGAATCIWSNTHRIRVGKKYQRLDPRTLVELPSDLEPHLEVFL